MASPSIVKFGERMTLEVILDQTTSAQVQSFLMNPKKLIEETWDSDMLTQLTTEKYRLKFPTIPFVELQAEIEIDFIYCAKNATILMRGGKCNLNSKMMKNNDPFLQSFDISLQGSMTVQDNGSSNTRSFGWIEYAVSAKSPRIFRLALPLQDAAIGFIKKQTKDFVTLNFPGQYLRAFQKYRTSTKLHSNVAPNAAWIDCETLAFYNLPESERLKGFDRFQPIGSNAGEVYRV